MIFVPGHLIAQTELTIPSLYGNVLTPDQQQALSQLQTPVETPAPTVSTSPSLIPPTPSSAPIINLVTYLKTRFFGKTIPLSDSHHVMTGLGVVIGVEKIENSIYFNMHATDSDQTYKARVVFEKLLGGVSFREAAMDPTAGAATRLDTENRISAGLTPLLGDTATATPITTNPTQPAAPPRLGALPHEAIDYYDPSSDDTLPGALSFYKGNLYFSDDGSPIFVRAQKE